MQHRFRVLTNASVVEVVTDVDPDKHTGTFVRRDLENRLERQGLGQLRRFTYLGEI